MNRIKILKEEIENLERNKNTKMFMKLLNNEKIDAINEQLEIIKKQLEIVNIVLEKEWVNQKVQEAIGRPPIIDDRQKEIIRLIKENEHKMSPAVLSLYDWKTETSEIKKEKEEVVEKIDESNIMVNVESYLNLENDSDYENEVINKLKTLEISEESKESVDIKPNIPVVVPQSTYEVGNSSKSGWTKDPNWEDTYVSEGRRWRTEEAEQINPRRKYIDRRQYFIKRQNTVPIKYIPYDKEPQALNPTGIYLDLDCVEDKGKMLTQRIKENGIREG